MTVDLLAATFWPEGALFGGRSPHAQEEEPAAVDHERPEAADAAVRAERFWAAVARHLWCASDASGRP